MALFRSGTVFTTDSDKIASLGEVARAMENCSNVLNQKLREWILFNLLSSINKNYKPYFIKITLKTLEELQGLSNLAFSKKVFQS